MMTTVFMFAIQNWWINLGSFIVWEKVDIKKKKKLGS